MNEQPVSITCPVCEWTSWHPWDVRHGYCNHCHAFTNDPWMRALMALIEQTEAAATEPQDPA